MGFLLRRVSNGFKKDEISNISLNGTVCDISVDHRKRLEKENILNIHEKIQNTGLAKKNAPKI